MYQVNFSEQSMKELNQLDITKQMEIAEIISSITKEALANPTETLQSFHRDKTVYYRVRANDFRIYFELKDEQLFAHYILHKNTLSDFIFRTKLPVNEEFLAEQEDSFWKYLDSLK
jgi:mRNA interferase RelE/StbE